jgi:hypothetical protein
METVRIELGTGAPNIGALRTTTFERLLDRIDSGTLADLGAGHCLFSLRAASCSFDVTAVDGRTERLPSPEDLRPIRFVQSDVRHFDVSGFDVVSIIGLLYHLTLEDQIDLIGRSVNAAGHVIVETQIHDAGRPAPADQPWQADVRKEGRYEGILFPENENPMASIGNATSFWHTEESLLRLFEDSGAAKVTVVEPAFESEYGPRKFYSVAAHA